MTIINPVDVNKITDLHEKYFLKQKKNSNEKFANL